MLMDLPTARIVEGMTGSFVVEMWDLLWEGEVRRQRGS